ncbi:extracellular solute-binding protein [Halobiforma nitratireducens]|uniref:Iron(III) ABC transporter periplasmic substrate-binding protein n=1 Tax=Halobiforma nitratireducens JCM 10879 TaxID=1227454 RepID=M0M8H2_9EURY|nr:extracellular solute-binding protein [Halobiforma nitratireducens]EMA40909.1 iron(III) ABC transporter periplasmic substrate-binding protein [Halobiforma nitratireducens JCM 10879]
MQDRNSDRTNRTTTGRRPFLVGAGVSAAGLAGLAGCLGDNGENGTSGTDDGSGSTTGSVTDADPLANPVDSSGVSWDDLGDLEGEITVYSGRTRDQIDLVFEELENEYDGLTIDRDYDDNDAQVNQLVQESDATPADVFYSQDPGALGAVHDEGLVQQLPEDVVDAVPESYREPDGHWTGVSGRVRSIMYNADRLDETPLDSWDELPTDISEYATDDRFEGIISTRPNSGTFRGFIQAMVDLEGEDATRQWVSDFMDQDPVRYGSGSTQAEEINRGGDDDPIIGLGNSYYAARLVNEDPDSPIRVTFTEGDAGALFSVAGIAVTNDVDDPELVAEFARHLVAVEGQEFMMDDNGEFPVVDGVDYVGPLPGPEELDSPTYDLSSFDMELQGANELLEDEGMMPL